MNYSVEKSEQHAIIHVKEDVFNGIVGSEFETIARGLIREGYKNLIVDLKDGRDLDSAGSTILKKINMLCTRELGIMVLVSEHDDFVDQLYDAKIHDVAILSTIEEAVDAVFMNDIENEFEDEADDFEEDEFEAGGYSRDE
jgi:anti-anti-sigma regulatory factor